MKYSFAAAALATLASALPAPQAGTSTPLRFGGLAIDSGSPIQYASINANGLAFWLNKPTTTSCPSSAGSACDSANTNSTTFTYTNGAGTLGLSTQVPGGQQVYVTEGDEASGQLAGQLRFTQAHSVSTAGPALYDGFNLVYDGHLQFEGKDWFACPVNEPGSDAYGIWAVSRVAGSQAGEGCLDFAWKIVQDDDSTPTAWQYE